MNDIFISVLLPTRYRTALVERSVKSLLSLSTNPNAIEIIIAYDQDDLQSHSYFESAEWSALVDSHGAKSSALKCPCWGYQGLNHYYTAAAKQAQGQWFLIWNDDAVMITPNWDDHVQANSDFVGMMHIPTENFKSSLTLFPLIPRVWLDLFGEISQHQLNDSWIQDICHQAGAVIEIPVKIFHDRYDVTGNNLDTTYQNRMYGKKLYYHEHTRDIRSRWAQHLKQYREQTSACGPRLLQI